MELALSASDATEVNPKIIHRVAMDILIALQMDGGMIQSLIQPRNKSGYLYEGVLFGKTKPFIPDQPD